MARLVRLHQYAEAAETCESLAPLVFVRDKYAQDCWLKASAQPTPQCSSLQAGSATGTVVPAAIGAGAAPPAAAGTHGLASVGHCPNPVGSVVPADCCQDDDAVPMEV